MNIKVISNLLVFSFLIFASTSSVFLIFGDNIKNLFIAAATLILLIVYLSFSRKDRAAFFVSFFYFVIFSLFFFLAEHNVTHNILHQFLFLVINLILFNIGSCFALAKVDKISFSKTFLWVYLIMALVFNLRIFNIFIFNEFTHFRDLGEHGVLNAIGIAYTRVVLFFITFWIYQIIRKPPNENSNKIRLSYLYLLLLLIIFLNLIFTLSRGPLILMILTFIYFYIDHYRNFFLTIFRLFGVFIILYLLFNYIDFFQDRIYMLIERVRIYNISDFKYDRSISERLLIYNDFINNFKYYLFGKFQYTPYPHNIIIELFQRIGIFSLPILFLMFKSFFQKNTFLENSDNLIGLFVILFFYCFLQGQMSLSLDNNRFLWVGLGYFYTKK